MGVGDYWDDVDAVVRNHLVEQQLVRADLLARVAAQFQDQPDSDQGDKAPRELCFDDVIARSIGAFGAISLPNSIPRPWVMQCCTGNGTQGLYYAWEGTLRETGAQAIVNLFLNRAGRLVDIDSYLPFEGKVVIRNKAARRIAVRIPSWVDLRVLRCDVNDVPREPSWTGRYMSFDDLQPGTLITLRFPLAEETATYTVNAHTPQEQAYRCEFRGSTLLDISPRDDAPTSYPLYVRDHLRARTAPTRQVTRFVAAKVVRRW